MHVAMAASSVPTVWEELLLLLLPPPVPTPPSLMSLLTLLLVPLPLAPPALLLIAVCPAYRSPHSAILGPARPRFGYLVSGSRRVFRSLLWEAPDFSWRGEMGHR